MKFPSQVRSSLLVAAFFGLFPSPLCHYVNAAEPELYYYYNGAKRSLELDDSQLAVKLRSQSNRPEAPSDDEAKAFARGAASLGFKEEDGKSLRPGGWIKVETPSAAGKLRDAAQKTPTQRHKELVDALANVADVEFAAPVFKDTKGKPVNLEPTILIGFVDGTSEVVQEAVLRKIKNVKSTRRVGAKNKWIVETHFRNGFEVLAAPNELGGLAIVRYAEPNFIVSAESR